MISRTRSVTFSVFLHVRLQIYSFKSGLLWLWRVKGNMHTTCFIPLMRRRDSNPPKKSHFSDKESILDSKIKPFSKNKHIYCVNNRCWRSDYINNCTAAIKPRVLLFTTHPSLSVFTERGSQTIHVVVNHASRAAGRTSPLSCEATFWVSASQKHVKVM